jgi:murein DD-endopeptidase MepM/ murein hydrolase activator NlpD
MLARFGRLGMVHLGVAFACFVLSADVRACATVAAPTAKVHFIHPAPTKMETAFGPRFHPLLNTRRHHDGIDYFAKVGDPVQAAADGEVTFAGNKGEYGIAIEIRHDAGWTTIYAHLNWPTVRAGDCVKAGAVIGASGNTGFLTGPHLHFEIRQNDKVVDPTSLLDMTGRN